MKFNSDSAFLFKVTPVYKKDDKMKDTDAVSFYRLTFRTCSVSSNALAMISYYDVIPTSELSKYNDSWLDMVGKSFKISGSIQRTWNKDTQKGYTNFYLSDIQNVA